MFAMSSARMRFGRRDDQILLVVLAACARPRVDRRRRLNRRARDRAYVICCAASRAGSAMTSISRTSLPCTSTRPTPGTREMSGLI